MCISVMFIWSTLLKMFLFPVLVRTINSRCPQPYLKARLIKQSIIYLVFETEISNLSDSFSISFLSWIKILIPCGSLGFMFSYNGLRWHMVDDMVYGVQWCFFSIPDYFLVLVPTGTSKRTNKHKTVKASLQWIVLQPMSLGPISNIFLGAILYVTLSHRASFSFLYFIIRV